MCSCIGDTQSFMYMHHDMYSNRSRLFCAHDIDLMQFVNIIIQLPMHHGNFPWLNVYEAVSLLSVLLCHLLPHAALVPKQLPNIHCACLKFGHADPDFITSLWSSFAFSFDLFASWHCYLLLWYFWYFATEDDSTTLPHLSYTTLPYSYHGICHLWMERFTCIQMRGS